MRTRVLFVVTTVLAVVGAFLLTPTLCPPNPWVALGLPLMRRTTTPRLAA
jgi:hypothetical protein